MKIALMHYHLKPGGVTTVLKQQAAAISASGEVLVITGHPPDPSFPFDTVYVPELGYDGEATTEPDDPRQVAQTVEAAIFSKWKKGCDVLHVHNPTLKKNRNFLAILKELQKRRLTLFLQIHDFAEDGRPQVYFNEAYPADCHYGVINSRDEAILKQAGLKAEGLHRIFNTIQFFDSEKRPSGPNERPLVLYPIRAIRRKNIGEAILLSLFFQESEVLHITLPPNSPADIESYLAWQHFVKKANLRVVFDAGLREAYSRLVGSARFMITTSITEGFGFCFLEPWTAHKPLWGRKLPDICRDFETRGVTLNHLYEYLRVPLTWLGKKRIFDKWAACVTTASRFFNLNIDTNTLSHAFERMITDETIDFGLLDEALQKKVICRILSEKKDKDALVRLNPYLAQPGKIPQKEAVIKQNHRVITKTYNRQIYQETLMQIYTRVTKERVHQRIDKKVLITRFFGLNTFSLLKWGPYAV